MSIIKYLTGSLLIMTTIVACKKEDSPDVTGDPEVKFFTNNETLGNAPVNSKSYSVVNYPDVASNNWLNLSHDLPATIKFPVFATQPLGDDVTVGAELDNSLVAKYNTEHSTSFAVLPNGFLNTTGLSARILKGQTRSTDSISIATTTTNVNTLTEPAYLVPIKLTTVSNPSLGAVTSTNSMVTYIVLNVELRRIKYLAAAAEAQGTLITPRTSWAVTFNPAPQTTGSVTDGSTTTFSRFGVTPVTVDVNLQASKNVTGIRLYTSNNATHIPTGVDVYLSSDGINYTLVGKPLRANLTYASSYNYILFYKAIPANYVRLVLYYTTSTNTQNTRVTELDVYAN
jgi:hypothetical protein